MGSTGSRRQQPHSLPSRSGEASVRASLLGGYQRMADGPVEHLAQEAANARRRMHYTAKLAACFYNTRNVMGHICTCQAVLAVVMLMIVATVMWFHWDQIGPVTARQNVTEVVRRIATTTSPTSTTPTSVVFE